MAIYNAAFLASEIKNLRIISVRQKRKRKTPRLYITTGGVLTAEEGQNRIKKARIANKTILNGVTTQASGRAPPKYSIYNSLEYNARVCPIYIA